MISRQQTNLDEQSHSPQHQEGQLLSFHEFSIWGCQNITDLLFTTNLHEVYSLQDS